MRADRSMLGTPRGHRDGMEIKIVPGLHPQTRTITTAPLTTASSPWDPGDVCYTPTRPSTHLVRLRHDAVQRKREMKLSTASFSQTLKETKNWRYFFQFFQFALFLWMKTLAN
jgi:hypothetical protein